MQCKFWTYIVGQIGRKVEGKRQSNFGPLINLQIYFDIKLLPV